MDSMEAYDEKPQIGNVNTRESKHLNFCIILLEIKKGKSKVVFISQYSSRNFHPIFLIKD